MVTHTRTHARAYTHTYTHTHAHTQHTHNAHNTQLFYTQYFFVLLLCRDFYFVDVTWISSSQVQVTWLNREQNTAVYTQYNIQDDGSISSQYKYISQAWVELVSVCYWY